MVAVLLIYYEELPGVISMWGDLVSVVAVLKSIFFGFRFIVWTRRADFILQQSEDIPLVVMKRGTASS